MSNRLSEKQRALEDELSEQFSEISNKAQEVGKQALIIAGGIFVTYQLVRFMSSSSKKKKKKSTAKVYHQLPATTLDESGNARIIIQEAPKHDKSSFLSEIKAELGAVLMSLAKEKLYEAIENMSKNTKSSDEETEHS